MARVSDIDTKAVVNRFLQRDVITKKTDDEANTADETDALLESIATAFLLDPQAAIPLILRAKNSLLQVIDADIAAIDFLINAIRDLDNPDKEVEDLSDLTEAQTALVELDRLGRVGTELQAFQRYENAVRRFLDDQLAPILKRKGRKEFERTGVEARQDIFKVLQQFGPTHRVMADRVGMLQRAVEDLRSVDLTKMVSTKTLERVRKSILNVNTAFKAKKVSKTTAAVELLGGVASLKSIAKTKDIFDPVVHTVNVEPDSRTIYLEAPQVLAEALSSAGAWTLGATPWDFNVSLNVQGTPSVFSIELPFDGVAGYLYIVSSKDTASSTYTIPTDGKLFLQLTNTVTAPEIREISLTAGVRTVAQLVTEIDAAHSDIHCTEFKADSNRFIIWTDDAAVTSIVVYPAANYWVDNSPAAPSRPPSAHEALGFEALQTSDALGLFTAATLLDCLEDRLTGVSLEVVDGDKLKITSEEQDSLLSSVRFDGGVEDTFGFTGTVESEPAYLTLVEDSVEVSPESLKVFIGSTVTAKEELVECTCWRHFENEVVTNIDNNKLYFGAASLLRGTQMEVVIESPATHAVQEITKKLKSKINDFDEDFTKLINVASPLISKPTRAQTNDALRVLSEIRAKLTNSNSEGLRDILGEIIVRKDRSAFEGVANKVINSLEERGLDRAQDLSTTGRFSDLFSLTKNDASRSGRFMTAMASVVNTDIPISFIEEDIDDSPRLRGSNPGDPVDAIETEGDDQLAEFD